MNSTKKILASLVLLGGLVVIVYFSANIDKFENSFADTAITEKITAYDCSKNLAEYYELITYIDPTESIAAKSPERISVYEKEAEILANSCEIGQEGLN